MTDFKFKSEDFENSEIVSEFSMEGYEKYRLKNSDITVDISVVDLSDRDKDEYIQGRKDEITDNQTEVPHPYKPEKKDDGRKKDLVKFKEDPLHGKGFADPEYNLVSKNGSEITRHRYLVTWKHFQNQEKLAEIEAYFPKDKFELKDILNSIRSVSIEE